MVWVRSEYAGELAVLATWASALLPWSVSFTQFSPQVSRAVVRFPLFMFQFIYGVSLGAAERPFLTVAQAPGFPADPGVGLAYLLWLGGAAPFGVALAVSVAYYLREERVEAGPVDPVQALGALLGLSAVALTGSTVLLWRHFAGLTVPVGVVFLYVFAGLLLTVDRT